MRRHRAEIILPCFLDFVTKVLFFTEKWKVKSEKSKFLFLWQWVTWIFRFSSTLEKTFLTFLWSLFT